MNNTPRTDAFEQEMRKKYYAHALSVVFFEALDYARMLERELSLAKRDLERLERLYDKKTADWDGSFRT